MPVGLDEVLRDAAVGQPGSLPLLQFTLEELYQQRGPDGTLRFSTYRSLGGLEGALRQRAEKVLADLPKETQAALPEVLTALVRVGLGEGLAVRRTAALDTFASPESRTLIDAFIAARLFIADRDSGGKAVVSIGHDALLRGWPRLEAWLEENRELLRVRERVALATTRWVESGKPGDLLLAEGKPLEEAVPLIAVQELDLSAEQRELIQASESRVRQRRRARWLMNWNGVALLVSAALILSYWLWKVVPWFAAAYAERGVLLPLTLRLTIAAANHAVQWLLPPSVLLLSVLYVTRKRIRFPEFIRSGMALAVASGVVLLLLLLVFFVTTGDLARVLTSPPR